MESTMPKLPPPTDLATCRGFAWSRLQGNIRALKQVLEMVEGNFAKRDDYENAMLAMLGCAGDLTHAAKLMKKAAKSDAVMSQLLAKGSPVNQRSAAETATHIRKAMAFKATPAPVKELAKKR